MNASPSDGSIEAEWTIESGERLLRLVLFRAGDRYAHRIEVRAVSGELAACVESLEGDAFTARELTETLSGGELGAAFGHPDAANLSVSDTWPASPAFQQFHEQEIDGVRTWFLVGMAGKSHWSASISAVPGESWEFDVACRYREIPTFLGSIYRLTTVGRGQSVVEWVMGSDGPGRVFKNRETGATVPMTPFEAPPASARWRYVCGFASSYVSPESGPARRAEDSGG